MPYEGSAPGAILATNIELLRGAKRPSWSQKDLAERLAEYGLPLHQTAIAKIEAGQRKVSVDEFLVLAAALDVSPLWLLLPIDRAPVQIGKAAVRCDHLAQWFAGIDPLPVRTEDFEIFESPDGQPMTAQAVDDRLQWWATEQMRADWRVMKRPGLAHLLRVIASRHGFAETVATDGRSWSVSERRRLREQAHQLADSARHEIDRQLEELDRELGFPELRDKNDEKVHDTFKED